MVKKKHDCLHITLTLAIIIIVGGTTFASLGIKSMACTTLPDNTQHESLYVPAPGSVMNTKGHVTINNSEELEDGTIAAFINFNFNIYNDQAGTTVTVLPSTDKYYLVLVEDSGIEYAIDKVTHKIIELGSVD